MRKFIFILLFPLIWSCEQITPTKLGKPITDYDANTNYQVTADGILSVDFETAVVAHDRGVAIYVDENEQPTTAIGELHVVPIITRDVKVLKGQYFRVETRGDSISVFLTFRPII